MTSENDSGLGSGYKFYAFISYSHADESFVKKLQEKIETYRLPSSLNKLKDGLPKKVHPLFRDATDLPPGQLSEEIRKKMAESKYLIVICSPNSASSYWVNKEIEEFRRLGRGDRIIPVIIEGRVGATDEQGRPDTSGECYPEALLKDVKADPDNQLLGVSVPQDGPRKAILKVIAKMLELGPDDLIARDQAREKQRLIVRLAAAAAVMLAIGIGGFIYWDYHREKTAYFVDYVDKWGLPHGLFPLTDQEASAGSGHYRFIFQRRKLKEVTHVDSAGRPVEHRDLEYLDRPVIQTFIYEDQTGRLLSVNYLDRNRNLVVRLAVSGKTASAIDYKRANEENETLQAWLTDQTTASGRDSFGRDSVGEGLTAGGKSQVQRWRVSRNEAGHMTKIEYRQMESEKPAQDRDGVFGQEFELDELGRIISRSYLDAEGRKFNTQAGVAGKTYKYEGPYLVETVNRDVSGLPALDNLKRMITTAAYDPQGRKIEERYLDASNSLYPGDDGIAAKTWQYDAAGRITEEAYFGLDNRPWRLNKGYSGRRWKYEDEVREESFFGPDGQSRSDQDGLGRIREKFDQRLNLLERSYFDLDGQPLSGPEGFHLVVFTYDQPGNLVEESYFDVDTQPAANSRGYAGVKRRFNVFNQITEEAFFGPDGRPALNNLGYARLVNEYDDRGAPQTTSYFGVDDQPAMSIMGYARLSLTTDRYGRPLSLAFFDGDGRPVVSAQGYARSEVRWNDQNLMEEIRFFDQNDRPVDPSGQGQTAGLKFEYDQQGRTLGTAVIDTEGRTQASIQRSQPTENDLNLEDGNLAVKPAWVDLGTFTGEASAEVTIFNLTEREVRLSRALGSHDFIQAEYADGRTVPARGAARLKITCRPPADSGGNLNGAMVTLAAAIEDQPPVVIAVLGQYNTGAPRAEPGRGGAQAINIIGYNPQKEAGDPFDYSRLITQGRRTVMENADGSRVESILDEHGRVTESVTFDQLNPEGRKTRFSYDEQGRAAVIESEDGDGRVTTFKHGADGSVAETVEIEPDGQATTFKFKDGDVMEVETTDPENPFYQPPSESPENEQSL